MRGDDEDFAFVDDDAGPAGGRTEEIPGGAAGLLELDQGAEGDRSGGVEIGDGQCGQGGAGGGEFGGQARLTFGEVGRFLAVGVVFAFGAALLVGGLVAGERGGALLIQAGFVELRDDELSHGFLVHTWWCFSSGGTRSDAGRREKKAKPDCEHY